MQTIDQLAVQYVAVLEDYLDGAGESALNSAYELGRKAITDGVGVLEMVSVHNKALKTLFRGPVTGNQAVKMAGRASAFFAESLAPFEMVLLGIREANATLRRAEEELHRQNEELSAAQQLSDAQRQRYQELFEFAPDGYLVTDLDGIIQEANRPASVLLQTNQDLLAGQSLLQFVAADQRESLQAELGWLRRGRLEKVTLWQFTIQCRDGNPVPVELNVGAVRDPQGRLMGLRWLLRDATERELIEEEKAQLRIRECVVQAEAEAARRLKFLAEVSTALTGSLDCWSVLERIPSLAVPSLADCCFVYQTDGDMAVRHFAAEHSDPQKGALLKNLQFIMPDAEVPPLLAGVLCKAMPEIIPEISSTWLKTFACGSGNFEILRDMNFTSALLAPLTARGQPLGVIAFFAAESSRQYTPDDVALAAELAHRCALILENAWLYQQVVVEKDKAERASKTKEEFVAILSHELRTPLMSVLGWAHVLVRQPRVAENQLLSEGVRSLEHNAQNISRLVEDCLDIARISEGKLRLQRELVDVHQIAHAAFEATRKLADDKNLKFAMRSSEQSFVWGDKTRLEGVILNLLTNAIKFTEEPGQVSIAVRRADGEVEIEVKDTGIGIEPDFLEQIFEPFRQGTKDWLSSKSGLGIGLAIVREIVEMHGGRVWAESRGRGCGSDFRLRLPLSDTPARTECPEVRQYPDPLQIKPLRILFIEDSVDALNLMKIELEALGHSVYIAADGASGLTIAKRVLPEVIISDIKMPGLDGYELIKRLRRIPQLSMIPAIALTGFGMDNDVEKALNAGYNAHLCKPVELDHLSTLIQKLSSDAYKSI